VGTARVTLPDGDHAQIWYPVDPSNVGGKSKYTYHVRSWFPAALASNPALALLPDSVPTDSYENAPAATDTAATGDPNNAFPVLLFSHGYGSYPEQSSFLTDHLATWGFVIAAPDHRSRDLGAVLSNTVTTVGGPDLVDLDNMLSFLHVENNDPSSVLYGGLDFSKVGVFGHSAGGGTAVTMAASNPAIRTYVALAPAAGVLPSTAKPGLVMYGSSDTVVSPSSVQQLYSGLPAPKRLIVITATGHNVFDDICEIHNGNQRLVDLLKTSAGSSGPLGQVATLADDGCFPPDVSPPSVWPLIDQAVTAQMRYGLGIDKAPRGLNSGLDHAYPGVSADYYQKL
jgi:pimeloyl-ACP methyl ester carboxylesterase